MYLYKYRSEDKPGALELFWNNPRIASNGNSVYFCHTASCRRVSGGNNESDTERLFFFKRGQTSSIE